MSEHLTEVERLEELESILIRVQELKLMAEVTTTPTPAFVPRLSDYARTIPPIEYGQYFSAAVITVCTINDDELIQFIKVRMGMSKGTIFMEEPQTTKNVGTGTAAKVRIASMLNPDFYFEGSVGTAGASLNLTSTSVIEGHLTSLCSLTLDLL